MAARIPSEHDPAPSGKSADLEFRAPPQAPPEPDMLFAVSLAGDEEQMRWMTDYLLGGLDHEPQPAEMERAFALLADVGIDIRRLAASDEGAQLVWRLHRLYGLLFALLERGPGEIDGDDGLTAAESALESLEAMAATAACEPASAVPGDSAAGPRRGMLKKRVFDLLEQGMPNKAAATIAGCSVRHVQRCRAEREGRVRDRRRVRSDE